MKHPLQSVGLFLAGPLVLLLLLAILSLFVLLVFSLRRADRLAALGGMATERLERSGLLPTLWGLSAGVLVFAATAVLLGTKVLALLGILVFLAGIVLVSLGLAVAALRAGRTLTDALDQTPGEDVHALRLGLSLMFLASLVPFLGWLGVGVAIASGTGALLEALFSRR